MKRLMPVLFLLVGAIIGAACSHVITGTAKASLPQYRVVDLKEAHLTSLSAKGFADYLNTEAQKGYDFKDQLTDSGWLLFEKQ